MIRARVDIEPDSPAIRHFHPGEEIIYVLEGSLEYQIDGQPTKVYREGLPQPHLLSRSRPGRPFRRVGGTGPVRRRNPGRIPITRLALELAPRL
jgi:hypothetical protein